MSRPVSLLAAVGTVLGAAGAVGWHWDPLARLWYPAWIVLPPGPPRYSGVIPRGSVSDWGRLWWPPFVALPVAGALLGAVLGVLVARQRHQPVAGLLAVVVLGLLVGVASALAWHATPIDGIGWAGGWNQQTDLSFPVLGVAAGLLAGAVVRVTGLLR